MRFRLEGEVSRLNYTDGNRAHCVRCQPDVSSTHTQPVLRVGLGYRRDDTRFRSPLYYTPQDFNALSVLADYAYNRGRLRYGLTAGYPISGRGDDADNRPAKTLFGYVDYEASDIVTLFLNGGVVDAPNFESRDITLGGTLFF
jgi:hypothetical protein